MLAKIRLAVVISVLGALSGCASTAIYSGVGAEGSEYQNSRSQGGGPLGMSGTDAGTVGGVIAGGAAGSIIGNGSGPATAIGAVAGGFVGWMMGSKYDTQRAAVGTTKCNWRSSGTTNPDGTPEFKRGDWGCSGGNSVSGNRHVPPEAHPQ